MKSIITAIVMLLSFTAFGKTTDAFTKRFQFERKDGKVVTVRDNSIGVNFSIAPYVNFIKSALLNEQAFMQQAGLVSDTAYDEHVEDMLTDQYNFRRNKKLDKQIENVVKSLKELGKLNIEKIFSNPKFNEVLAKFEFKLTDALIQLDPRVIARPEDPNFFVTKNRIYEAVKFGLKMAKKMLGEVPLLNTATYVIVEVEKMVRTQREFHQNMFLHYLQNFTPEELGLTRTEADHIFSSIYESKIPWYAFWESKAAALNWDNYGFNKFGKTIKAGTTRLLNFKGKYDKRGQRVNFAFSEVTKDAEDVIVNLVDFENMIQREPAVAFSRTNPNKIKRRRVLLQLGQLGLSFVPLSAWLKDIAEDFMKSMYEKQQITEGALYGYFESNVMKEDMALLRSQYVNPFDSL